MTAVSNLRTRAQVVADQLRAEILSGALPAGTRIRQAELAKRLGVSTTPVREALSVLERERLVIADAYRGVEVVSISLADVEENFKIRTRLEMLAIEEAARKATPQDILDLEAIVEAMEDPIEAVQFFQLNRELHARMYLCAAMPRLSEIINQLRDAADVYLRVALATEQANGVSLDLDVTRAEHRELVNILRRHAPRQASVLIASHLGRLGHELVQYFQASL